MDVIYALTVQTTDSINELYFKELITTQKLIDSQCVIIDNKIYSNFKEMYRWLNEYAIELDSMPTFFTFKFINLSNKWAKKSIGRCISIWIQNDDIRTQFKLTFL